MAYKYIFDPVSADEYESAYSWYKLRSEVAADRLLIIVAEAIKSICANPFRYRNTFKKLREFSLKKYPYNIIYYIDEVNKIIIITSFYHHKRNPKKKYKK